MTEFGSDTLPAVEVTSYSLEIRDGDRFLGDRARKGAFTEVLDELRQAVSKAADDPLGDKASDQLSSGDLDKMLLKGEPRIAGMILGAVEGFSQRLADVLRRFLDEPSWKSVERIAVGGGMRDSRIGEFIIGRTATLLNAGGHKVTLTPIANDPDHAGMVGGAYLVPTKNLTGCDVMLAVDIGGSNIRAALLELPEKRSARMKNAIVLKLEHWEYSREAEDLGRGDVVDHLVDMLEKLADRALKDNLVVCPIIAVACPGRIDEDGSILAGGQNLPGNWEAKKFNLPKAIAKGLPEIGGTATEVVMHNDAVVQGLSEIPAMTDVERWAVVTIGTGLGNASFVNRSK